MRYRRILTLGLVSLAFLFGGTMEAFAQTLYKGAWIAESFGNDKVGGTDASEFFQFYAAPQGILCNPREPVCPLLSTPYAFTTDPGTGGTEFHHSSGSWVAPKSKVPCMLAKKLFNSGVIDTVALTTW